MALGTFERYTPLPRLTVVQGKRIRIIRVKPDKDLTYLLGFALGDGSFSHRTVSVHQSLQEAEFVMILKSLMQRLGTKYGGSVIERIEQNRLMDLTWCNSKIIRTVKFLGTIRYPEVERLLQGKFSADFIAGFWDADGDVERSHPRLHNTNLQLLRKIWQVMRNRWGIESSIRPNTEAGSKLMIRGQIYVSRRTIYILQVSRTTTRQWAQSIGSRLRCPRKAAIADMLAFS